MKKNVSFALSVLLILSLFLLLTACGGTTQDQNTDDKEDAAVVTEAETEAPTEAKYAEVGDTFNWRGATLTLKSVEAGSEGFSSTEKPGSWAVVAFDFSGEMDSGDSFDPTQDFTLFGNTAEEIKRNFNIEEKTDVITLLFQVPEDADLSHPQLEVLN